MSGAADLTDLDATEFARSLADYHQLRPGSIELVIGLGSVNHVFIVRSHSDAYVIRFARDSLRQNEFEVEGWCLNQAAAHGIPSPATIATGVHRGVCYLIQTFVDGAPGTSQRSADLWRTLGRYARIVHRIPLTEDAPNGLFSRFGRDLPAAWQAHLDYHLGQLNPADPLIKRGVYDPRDQTGLRSLVSRLRARPITVGLSHGDLSIRNTLVQPDTEPVLLDWGSASTGPTPYGDLLTLLKMHRATGDPSSDELAAFADGCGLDLAAELPILNDLLVLSHLDLLALGHRSPARPATRAHLRGPHRSCRVRPAIAEAGNRYRVAVTSDDARDAQEHGWRQMSEINAAYQGGELDRDGWHRAVLAIIEPTYLAAPTAEAGSGHQGSPVEWEQTRSIVMEAIDQSGTFLDIGCANGLLMESVHRWGRANRLAVEPYGVDIGPRLAELARARYPRWADRIWCANAATWNPDRRFDFVRTAIEYVPADELEHFLRHLLAAVVAPHGRLIVGKLNELRAAQPVSEWARELGLPVAGEVRRPHSHLDLEYTVFWIGADALN